MLAAVAQRREHIALGHQRRKPHDGGGSEQAEQKRHECQFRITLVDEDAVDDRPQDQHRDGLIGSRLRRVGECEDAPGQDVA